MSAAQDRLGDTGDEPVTPMQGGSIDPSAGGSPPEPPSSPDARRPADRGIPSVNRVRSVQSRVSSALAFTLMAMLGGGFLVWYYRGTAERPARAAAAAVSAARTKASGEMPVPPLGAYARPTTVAVPGATPAPDPIPLAEKLLTAPPPVESARFAASVETGLAPGNAIPNRAASGSIPSGGAGQTPVNPEEALRTRQLSGPVFATNSGEGGGGFSTTSLETGADARSLNSAGASEGSSPLGGLLHPTPTAVAEARVLPTRELLLPKGSFLDCTLETAIDSSLPGLATCITATDTFSADGRVVLLERGSKLVGETRGEARRGSNRLFVLWTEARTPTGVVVELASPGTDALGRAGVAGEVERHFWERFGAAILISVINGAIQTAVASQNSGTSSTVVVGPGGAQDVMSEVLRDTVSIPPTISVAQGSRIQVLVARDLDFRSVYALVPHPAPAH